MFNRLEKYEEEEAYRYGNLIKYLDV
jgi:hypothetical protein